MSFSNVQNAVKAVLQTIPSLANTVTLSDDGVLNRGVTEAVIIRPSAANFPEQVGSTVSASWGCYVEIYQRFIDDTTTTASFVILRDSMIDKLLQELPNVSNPYSTISSTDLFRMTSLSSQGDPAMIAMQNGNVSTGPVFMAQKFLVTIQEYIVITGA